MLVVGASEKINDLVTNLKAPINL